MKRILHFLLWGSLSMSFSLVGGKTDVHVPQDFTPQIEVLEKDLAHEQKDVKDEKKISKKWNERLKHLAKGLGWTSLNFACAAGLCWFTYCLKKTYYCVEERKSSTRQKLKDLGANLEDCLQDPINQERWDDDVAEYEQAKLLTYALILAINSGIISANVRYKMISNAWENLKHAFY